MSCFWDYKVIQKNKIMKKNKNKIMNNKNKNYNYKEKIINYKIGLRIQ